MDANREGCEPQGDPADTSGIYDRRAMTGWNITVYVLRDRAIQAHEELEAFANSLLNDQSGSARRPIQSQLPSGAYVAGWRSSVSDFRWVEELVSSGRAPRPSGAGYPSIYFARACDVAEALAEHGGPPDEKGQPHQHEPTDEWGPKTAAIVAIGQRARPSDWLLLEVWDES